MSGLTASIAFAQAFGAASTASKRLAPANLSPQRARSVSDPSRLAMIGYGDAEDADLAARSRDGDLRAFDEVVRRHQQMIARCLFRFCPYRADLEDLVQETFIKAFQKIDTWQATAPFENWLRRIAFNTGYDYFRKNNRNPASIARQQREEDQSIVDRLEDSEDQRHDYENTEQAQRALALLEPADRTLLTLQYLQELSMAEIAETMGWGISKTKVKSFRARKKLKKLLLEYEKVR